MDRAHSRASTEAKQRGLLLRARQLLFIALAMVALRIAPSKEPPRTNAADVPAGPAAGIAGVPKWPSSGSEWITVLRSTWSEIDRDNISIVAAGVAFYVFLSFVPLIAAIVLVFGLAADPRAIADVAQDLFRLLPREAAAIVLQQLRDMIATATTTKGWGLLLALATSIYGAMRASSATITALNIAQGLHEERSFLVVTRTTLALTIGLIMTGLLLVTLLSALALMTTALGPGNVLGVALGRLASWLVVATILSAIVAAAYYYGPSRKDANWAWLTPGSVLTTLGAMILTALFSVYVANFGNYNETYGGIAAVVVFLLWLYLLAFLFCIGAELNAETEKLGHSEIAAD